MTLRDIGRRVSYFSVKDKCEKRGVLRYVGPLESAEGMWVGIELDRKIGKNNGSFNGVRYFQCEDTFGVFVPTNIVTFDLRPAPRSGSLPNSRPSSKSSSRPLSREGSPFSKRKVEGVDGPWHKRGLPTIPPMQVKPNSALDQLLKSLQPGSHDITTSPPKKRGPMKAFAVKVTRDRAHSAMSQEAGSRRHLPTKAREYKVITRTQSSGQLPSASSQLAKKLPRVKSADRVHSDKTEDIPNGDALSRCVSKGSPVAMDGPADIVTTAVSDISKPAPSVAMVPNKSTLNSGVCHYELSVMEGPPNLDQDRMNSTNLEHKSSSYISTEDSSNFSYNNSQNSFNEGFIASPEMYNKRITNLPSGSCAVEMIDHVPIVSQSPVLVSNVNLNNNTSFEAAGVPVIEILRKNTLGISSSPTAPGALPSPHKDGLYFDSLSADKRSSQHPLTLQQKPALQEEQEVDVFFLSSPEVPGSTSCKSDTDSGRPLSNSSTVSLVH